MKLKIVSNGTAGGTVVVDERTGERVENLRCLDIHITPNVVSAKLELVVVAVEVVIHAAALGVGVKAEGKKT